MIDAQFKPYGVVVCGGKSSRMGMDKSRLVYYDAPQHDYVHDQLMTICKQVVISCNREQFATMLTPNEKVIDAPEFEDRGPISALLTAFQIFSDQDLLIVGCDYPFLSQTELELFLNSVQRESLAAAFYNQENTYEPVLAWYSKHTARLLLDFFTKGECSLQHFLNQIGADKYIPTSEISMMSVDTPEEFQKALDMHKETK
ncbi:molybdenum cofactor guanylyltransferase [Dyadobacter arcticus]|uniref:Probable molybdenum cofactor guanylyltransferase n=1 Tax=Dyadobacter arcticus TaxID=1078754 RepID=A0ABX0UMP4_9BACT|nr:molybdenum cofactor guanylyltransferase [Dyadobacter arcticus]NIJ53244.1 molybdopterin-guanine dinucleotide biosynthesis protein A [Dyadobacter arcticus]